MEGTYLKLLKDIPNKFQTSYLICESLFGILRSVRLQKSIGNHQDELGFSTPLDMKHATTLRQKRKYQSNSPDQADKLESGTLVKTISTPMKTQRKHQKSPYDQGYPNYIVDDLYNQLEVEKGD